MKKVFAIIAIVGLLLAGYVVYPIVFEGERQVGVKYATPLPVEKSVPKADFGEIREKGPATAQAAPPMQAAPSESQITLEPFRKISYEAFISLEVEDVRGTAFQVISRASQLGGYVYLSEITSDYASVIVKVPASSLWDALNYYRKLGKVTQERLSAKDVTERILDLEARIRNAKAEEQRLLDLYEKATDVKDMLAIEDRLSSVRERIERLEAMKKALENMVDYSTVHVELRKPGKPVEPGPSDLEKLLRDAYRALMGSIYLIVVVGAALLPLIAIGLLLYGIYLLRRRRSELA